ncbi:MAG: hypothetical protein KAV87_02270, partial [Desulfobacteraceae bacterium]|nr:hypothetical protein [Desulfobacteraceae bacterium]
QLAAHLGIDSTVIRPEKIIADARLSGSGNINEVIELDARGSVFNTTFDWRLTRVPIGSLTSITDPNKAFASMTPDLSGIYSAELIVTNEKGGIDSKQISITVEDPTIPPDPTNPIPDGPALYGDHCMQCHKPLATSAKKDKTKVAIEAAIKGGEDCMQYQHNLSCPKPGTELQKLTSDEINAIAEALKTTP